MKLLASELESVVNAYAPKQKVLLYVTDNVANIVKSTGLLGIKQHPCLASTLNLTTAQDAIKGTEGLQELKEKVCRIVTLTKHNIVAKDKFEEFQKAMANEKPKALIQEVSKRWNSCYEMLAHLYEQKAAVHLLLAEYSNEELSERS